MLQDDIHRNPTKQGGKDAENCKRHRQTRLRNQIPLKKERETSYTKGQSEQKQLPTPTREGARATILRRYRTHSG